MKKYQLSWYVTLLMALFLGGFAVDRFMMRQIGWGILKVLSMFLLVGIIWWYIDVILIAKRYKFKDVEWIEPEGKIHWLVMLLISVFFGYMGVDRFMLGQVWLGILKMVLNIFIIGIIWWIIDIVLIATKHKFEGVVWVDTY